MSSYRAAKSEIPALLEKHGPQPIFRMKHLMGIDDHKAIDHALRQLCAEKVVQKLGRADKCGFSEFRGCAIVFAPYGWKPPAKQPKTVIANGEYAMPARRTTPNMRWPAKSMRGVA